MKTRLVLISIGTSLLLSLTILRCYQKSYNAETHNLQRSQLVTTPIEVVPQEHPSH